MIRFKKLLFISMITFCSCSEAGKEQLLVGKWNVKFDRKACLANMQPLDKKAFESQPKAQQEAILKEIAIQIERDSWIEFKKDHTFEQVLLDGETKYMGQWEIKGGGSMLSLNWLKNKTDKTPQKETCEIIQLDAQNLYLRTKDKTTPELAYKRHHGSPLKKASLKP